MGSASLGYGFILRGVDAGLLLSWVVDDARFDCFLLAIVFLWLRFPLFRQSLLQPVSR